MLRVAFLVSVGITLSISNASAQAVDCERLVGALLHSPPGVYTPLQAQDMASVYNRECLGQQGGYQPHPQNHPPQQYDPTAQAVGEFLGTWLGGMMRR